jgi:hypothetical protein
MRTRYRLWAALIAIVVGSVLIATPASADQRNWTDRAGDMWVRGGAAAPEHRVMDIRGVHVAYTDRAVVLRVAFVELARRGRGLGLGITVRAPTLSENDWCVTETGPETYYTSSWKYNHTECGSVVAHASFDYARNVMRERIPVSYLDGARWVRLRFASWHDTRAGEFVDNPFGPNMDWRGWTPRLYRG